MAKKKELPRNEAPSDAKKASVKKKVDAMSSREKMDSATRTRNAAAKAGKIKTKKTRQEYTPPKTTKKWTESRERAAKAKRKGTAAEPILDARDKAKAAAGKVKGFMDAMGMSKKKK